MPLASSSVRVRSMSNGGQGTHQHTPSLPDAGAEPRKTRARRIRGAKRIRFRELPSFTRGLASMLSAGLGIDEALRTLELQTEAVNFRAVIRAVLRDVQHGQSLTSAMARCPNIFDSMYVNLLKTGEMTGALPETLDRLAEHLEAGMALRRNVQSAVVYPVIVTCIAATLVTAILVWIIPAFDKIYADLGAALPAPTQFLINVSNVVRDHVFVVLGAIGACVLGVKLARRTQKGALAWDIMVMRVPVFGGLLQKVALCRFAEALAQMIRGGVPILTGITLAGDVSKNSLIRISCVDARRRVQSGETLAASLGSHKVFPVFLVKFLHVGEKTGRLDEMFGRAASYYKNEVDTALKGLTAAIEPFLIAFLGLIIGGIVVCMFIPIFRMHELVAL